MKTLPNVISYILLFAVTWAAALVVGYGAQLMLQSTWTQIADALREVARAL